VDPEFSNVGHEFKFHPRICIGIGYMEDLSNDRTFKQIPAPTVLSPPVVWCPFDPKLLPQGLDQSVLVLEESPLGWDWEPFLWHQL